MVMWQGKLWSEQHVGSYLSWERFAVTALWKLCGKASFLFPISIRCHQRTSDKANWERGHHIWDMSVCAPVHLYVIASSVCVFFSVTEYLRVMGRACASELSTCKVCVCVRQLYFNTAVREFSFWQTCPLCQKEILCILRHYIYETAVVTVAPPQFHILHPHKILGTFTQSNPTSQPRRLETLSTGIVVN